MKLNEIMKSESSVKPNLTLGDFEETKGQFTTGEKFERALKTDSIGYQAYQGLDNYVEDKRHDRDENFNDAAKADMYKAYENDIHPDFKDALLDRAKNPQHMQDLLDDSVKQTKLEKSIDESGMSGIMMRIGAEITNLPLYAIPAVAAPRLAVAATATLKRRLITGATVELAAEVAKDVLSDKDRTALDYATSMTMGAGAYAVFGKPTLGLLQSATNNLKRKYNITDELEAKLASEPSKAGKEAIMKAHFEKSNFKAEDGVTQFSTELEKLQKASDNGTFNKGVMSKLRMDTAHLTAKSDSATMRQFSDNQFIDGTLQGNKSNNTTGNEMATAVEDRIIATANDKFNPIIIDFARDAYNKGHMSERFSSKARDVISVIADEVQHRRGLFGMTDKEIIVDVLPMVKEHGAMTDAMASEYIERILKATGEVSESSWDTLNQYGKKGFDETGIKKSKNYNTIIYRSNMDEAMENKGLDRQDFKNFIFGSLKSKKTDNGATTLTEGEEQQLKFLSGILQGKIWKSQHSGTQVNSSIDDVLKDALKEGVKSGEITEEFAQGIFKEVVDTTSSESVGVFGRARSPFNYAHKQNFMNKKGTVQEVSFMDLINKNFLGNNINYARKMGGSVALEKTKLSKNVLKKHGGLLGKASSLFEKIRVRGLVPENVRSELATKEGKEFTEQLNQLKEDIKPIFAEKTDDIIRLGSELFNAGKLLAKAETKGGDTTELMTKIADLEKQLDGLGMQELDLSNQINIDKARKWIEEDLIESGATKRNMNNELVRFDEMVNEYKGLPTATDPHGTATQLQRISRNLNIARLLGQTGITMSAELGGLVFHNGVKSILEFGTMKSLLKQMKTGKIDDKLAQEIQTFTGLGDSLNRAIGATRYDHEFDLATVMNRKGVDDMLNKFEGWSERASEATLLAGGVKPLQAQFEMLMAKSTINKITQMATKKSFTTGDLKWLNEVGIDEGMAKRIKDQIDTHGSYEKSKWSNGHKVQSLGYEKWADDEVKTMFTTSVRRISHNLVQKSHMGDKVGIVAGEKMFRNNIFGRMFLELKDYMVTAYVKQLGRAVGRKDAYMAGFIASQAMALSLGTSMQNFINYSGNPDKLEKSFEPTRFLQTVVGKMPQSSYMPNAIDTMLSNATGEKIFSDSRYNSGIQGAFMGMPTIDLLTKATTLLSAPFRTATTGEVANKDINALFGLMPLGNSVLGKPLNELLKN